MRIAYAAMAWTGLYVASKVSYALEGRLGFTGGPHVGYRACSPTGETPRRSTTAVEEEDDDDTR
ncbi:hypothetical protein [Nonomuraea sp. B19D2]|uniref:hypothetical protein n=1 Tax=Nonomuraea sp. B19D2 TaxID=3159561 RepID=UPI0032DAB6B5